MRSIFLISIAICLITMGQPVGAIRTVVTQSKQLYSTCDLSSLMGAAISQKDTVVLYSYSKQNALFFGGAPLCTIPQTGLRKVLANYEFYSIYEAYPDLYIDLSYDLNAVYKTLTFKESEISSGYFLSQNKIVFVSNNPAMSKHQIVEMTVDGATTRAKEFTLNTKECFEGIENNGEYVFPCRTNDIFAVVIVFDSKTLDVKYTTTLAPVFPMSMSIMKAPTGYYASVLEFASASNTQARTLYKISSLGAIEYQQDAYSCTREKSFSFKSYIISICDVGSYTVAITFDSNFKLLSKEPISTTSFKDAIIYPGREEIRVYSFNPDMYHMVEYSVKLDTCSDGYATATDGTCQACHTSCKTCTEPAKNTACLTCVDPYQLYQTPTEWSCTMYGNDSGDVSCLKNYAKTVKDVMLVSATADTTKVNVNVDLVYEPTACTKRIIKPSLNWNSQVDLTPQMVYGTSETKLTITIPSTLFEAQCTKTVTDNSKIYNCDIVLDLLTGQGNLASTFLITLDITITSENIATTRIIFGMSNLYLNQKSVNGTDVVPVDSKICTNEACSEYSNRTSYRQNEEILIIHFPKRTAVKLSSVSKLTADFPDGTSKDALSYLVSQKEGLNGSLETKIKLIDPSTDWVIVTFYLNTAPLVRRALEDTSNDPTNSEYFVSQYKFKVTPSSDLCEGFNPKCNSTHLAAIIIAAAAVLIVAGLVVFLCVICRKQVVVEKPKNCDDQNPGDLKTEKPINELNSSKIINDLDTIKNAKELNVINIELKPHT